MVGDGDSTSDRMVKSKISDQKALIDTTDLQTGKSEGNAEQKDCLAYLDGDGHHKTFDLTALNPEQQKRFGETVKVINRLYDTLRSGLSNMEAKRKIVLATPNDSEDPFLRDFTEKALPMIRDNMAELRAKSQEYVSVPVKFYPNRDIANAKTMYVTVPPSPDDVFMSKAELTFAGHSHEPELEAQLRNMSEEDALAGGISVAQLYFIAKKQGLV